jgi:hypothetical protein
MEYNVDIEGILVGVDSCQFLSLLTLSPLTHKSAYVGVRFCGEVEPWFVGKTIEFRARDLGDEIEQEIITADVGYRITIPMTLVKRIYDCFRGNLLRFERTGACLDRAMFK